jgi:hypothetical protein
LRIGDRRGLPDGFQLGPNSAGETLGTDALREAGVAHSFRQELGDAWTIRSGPLSAVEVSKALTAFIR